MRPVLASFGPSMPIVAISTRARNDPGHDISFTQHPALLFSWSNLIKDSGLCFGGDIFVFVFVFTSCAINKVLLQTPAIIPEHEQVSFGFLLSLKELLFYQCEPLHGSLLG